MNMSNSEQNLTCVNQDGRWVSIQDADPTRFYVGQPVHTGPFIEIGGQLEPNANTAVTYMSECVLRDLSDKPPGFHHTPNLEFVGTDEVTDDTGLFFVGLFTEKGTGQYGLPRRAVKTYSSRWTDRRTKRAVKPRV